MANNDLVFAQSPLAGPPYELVFGDEPSSNGIEINVVGVLPMLRGSIRLGRRTKVTIVGVLPMLRGAVSLRHLSNTQRPTVCKAASSWDLGKPAVAGLEDQFQPAEKAQSGVTPGYALASRLVAGAQDRLSSMERRRNSVVSRYDDAIGAIEALTSRYDAMLRDQRLTVLSEFTDAASRLASLRSMWEERLRDRRPQTHSFWQSGLKVRRAFGDVSRAGHAVDKPWQVLWKTAMRPPAGYGHRPPKPPEPNPCYLPNANLVFAAKPDGADLVFVCERHDAGPEPVVVPIREVYMVTNNVSLVRLVDGAPVPVLSASLSLDVDSWAWGFSASLPGAALALVAPSVDGAVELLASVNGTVFHVLAEQVSRERSFGQAGVRISGRGRNAVLDSPYAPSMAFTNPGLRTSQQLMDDVLTLNGVSMGWDVGWGLEAWNVPTGVFSHQGTYITALLAIAKAGGGYLLPHTRDKSLKVLPRYPVAPWHWDDVTPDFVLPSAVVTRESMAWKEKPAYNRVYVSGQDQGVLGRVTRAGTAGDVLAPMVVDQLITTAAAARQCGLPILADTGRQVEVGLRLPVLPETGIIRPGAFVQYQDGQESRLGLVRSVGIEAGFPDVWQTLGVETHA